MKARSAVVATLLVVLLLSALYPIRQYFSQKSSLAGLTVQENRLNDRIAELRAERSRLMTDAEVERIAREELGMVRPGEVAFAIVPRANTVAAAKPATAPAVDTARPRAGPTWYRRWWNVFSSALTGMR